MKEIIITNFQSGIGKSEFVGNGEIRNVDLNWREGIVRINLEPTKSSAGTVTVIPMWIVQNPDNTDQLWALDQSGNVYRGTASTEAWSKEFTIGSWASGSNGGELVWKDHLLLMQAQAAGNSTLHGYGPLSGSAILYSISSAGIDRDGLWHPLVVGQDDIVYGGAGRYIFSLQEVSGQNFAAGTAATFTLNARALDLPEGYRTRCLGELGKYLMIGTWKGTNIYDAKVADIFPWDRTSDSFNLPIRLEDNGIHAMVNADNDLYFFSGTNGKLNVTDGSSVKELARIPQQVLDISNGAYIDIPPGGVIHHNGKIVFGIYNPQGASSHIWSYQLDNGALVRENTVSTGTAASVRIGGLLSTGRDDFWAGWNDASGNEGIDHIQSGGNARRYSSYSAFVTSPYLQVGSQESPAVFKTIEIQLARPLVSGQGVRLSYRTDLSAAFTVIDTIDFATYAAVQNRIVPFQLEVQGGIQIRAELTTGSGASTSPELIKLILR